MRFRPQLRINYRLFIELLIAAIGVDLCLHQTFNRQKFAVCKYEDKLLTSKF